MDLAPDTGRACGHAAFDELSAARDAALAALCSLQKPDGHFCAELEGDSILESEYLLMKFILRQEDEPMADGRRGREVLGRIARCLRAQQREDGGWGQYPASATDVSATVKAWLALALMGDDPSAPHMLRAAQSARRAGGAESCNSFTKFYFAALGQVKWSAVPSVPPEILFIPKWFYFHLDKVSAWTRTMIVPLSIVSARRPTREMPDLLVRHGLFVDPSRRDALALGNAAPPHWRDFFETVDRILKAVHTLGGTPFRGIALRRAVQWMLDRAGQDGASETEGLGAIFPPMVYLQIALKAMGYRRDHPVIARAERELDAFFIEEGEEIRIQPCFSPVWDTGIALYAMTDAGMDERDASAHRAAAWLRARECRFAGDWRANVDPNTHAGGWWFEYRNAWYPDVDDTAMVAMALRRCDGSENRAASARGVAWILAMQNDDGGWAAFDRTRSRPILEFVPFADHNAMQDPSCPDITGRVLECLARHGYSVNNEPVRRAIRYVRSRQEKDGSFFGRWGVNYLYGTWQAIVGPIRCGVRPTEEWIQDAGAWVRSVQRDDGSFGESADSYIDPALKGVGPSTASQTAWGAMTLQAIYGAGDDRLIRALRWLARTQLAYDAASDPLQNPDRDPAGSWRETEFTGTGFPRVFYLRYHLYRLYFPLMALARWCAAMQLPHEEGVARLAPKVAQWRRS